MPEIKKPDYDAAINALTKLIDTSSEGTLVSQVAEAAIKGLRYLKSPGLLAEQFPNNLPYFSENLKSDFFSLISAPDDLTDPAFPSGIMFLGLYIYAIFLEIALTRRAINEQSVEVISFFSSQMHNFVPEFQARFELIRLNVMSGVHSKRVEETQENIRSLGERYTKEIGDMATTVTGWDSQLAKWSHRAEELETKLQDLAGDLNFVGLAGAFSNLIDAKKIEKRWQVMMMAVFGFILTLIPIGPLIASHLLGVSNLWSLQGLPYYLPFFILEILFLYFFRIFVNNFYSVKAQLLQLQLRYNICAFIQGYAEFIEKHKKSNDEKLFERFETLVFSGISADIRNIPSHFDGIEQITKLIKGVKSNN
jgi:hypothetical protein